MGYLPLDDNAVAILDEVKKQMQGEGIRADYSEAIRFLKQKADKGSEVKVE